MGIVYRNKKEIPIPQGLHINHHDGRVYSLKKNPDGSTNRLVLGYATSEVTMHVNENFKLMFPDLWKQYYGDGDIKPYLLHAGLYALCLGACIQNGLYKLVQEQFGPLHGNAIMDYAMFSITSRLNVTQLFPERMAEEVLFSDKVYSDSWFSDLFNNKIPKDEIHSFKLKWLQECKARRMAKAWISIDGSNNDCQVADSDLADQGKAKSRKNVEIVSYIYAVNATNGMPITYCVNDGSVVDSKAFQLLCMLLEDSGVEIEGVIIDRAFCTKDVLTMVRESGYRYVLMLKSNTYGHTQMMEEYADLIRWKAAYCVGDNGLFGITEKKKVFRNSSEEAYINLYFDGANGSERSVSLTKKIRENAREIQARIDKGETGTVPSNMKKYLSIEQVGGISKVVYNYEAWQKNMDEKGYYSIASSEAFGAEETNGIYHLRDASEMQFMIMKSMEGFRVSRVHSDAGIESKFAVCFITSILRCGIMNTCRGLGFDTNRMLKEIDRIQLLLKGDGRYYPIKNYTFRQKELLAQFGVKPENFDAIALDVTYRNSNPIKSQERRIPDMGVVQKRKRGRPPMPKETDDTQKEPKKRGRPKGSLNKKTLERLEQEKDETPMEKPRRGRPKGSLNKKTLERLKREAKEPPKEKRKPGRPKGSLNKKTIERATQKKL